MQSSGHARLALALALVSTPFASCAGGEDPAATRRAPPAAGPVAGGTAGMSAALEPIPGVTNSSGASPATSRPPAAGTAPKGGECGAVTQMAQNTLQPVDVILAVDTSGSMGEEIAFVKQNMNAFSQRVRDSGIDVHVILIATEKTGVEIGLFTDGVCLDPPLGSGMCPADSNPPGYAHINELIGQWNILDAYVYLYPSYKQYLRESSLKTFVSISDDDASTPADKFVSDVQALEPGSAMWSNWRYSGIYCFAECLGSFGVGATHAALVERTKGVGGDLCKQDFAPVFDAIATQLVQSAKLACDWEIPPPPDGKTFEPAKTNVRISLEGEQEELFKSRTAAECGTREAWHYDDENAPRRVAACPATCARIQAAAKAQVDLLFGCETQLGPI